ncbi:two-component system VirA-like sensor kinase [Phyllobacterium sp. SB3]|uniref:two-component system VirA-like sensor kinase n=1 Tax=Phyllobacterium sp. SB3 TaxID=3156073 RepID=UPI0032AEEC1D
MVLVAGAFCFAAFAFGRVPSREIHEDILTSLRAVDINHASLQRDVLQARAGLLRDYDPLVESVRTLHATVAHLSDLFPESGIEARAALAAELSKLSSSIDRDEELVEEFKTGNALLQNSLSIANRMLSKLHEGASLDTSRSLDTPNDLGNLMMRFATQPNAALGDTIRTQLDDMLDTPYGVMPDVRAYAVHAKMILDTLPAVDSIIQAIQASRTSGDAQTLQKVYLDAYGELSVRSSWSRVLLGSIALLLCGYVAWLIYRLKLQTQKLTQQLDLETLVADIKKRFNESFDDLAEAINDSLAMLTHFFDARTYAFAIFNNETGVAEVTFKGGDMLGSDALQETFRHWIQQNLKATPSLWRPFLYENLQHLEFDHFPEGSLSAGSVVATEMGGDSVCLLFLEHNEIRRKPDPDEVRLLGHALIALTQCIRAQRDKDERETLEARLEHAQRLEALGTLAGGIAHEFNNSLGAILGYGEMALQLDRDPATTRQYVQEMVSSGHRAKFIIDQILTFSRKRDRVSRPFDVSESVRDILPMIRMSISDSFIVAVELEEKLPPILGNPIELQQIITNLCMNAAQASIGPSEIKVMVSKSDERSRITLSHGELTPGSYVLVQVEDHGAGIPDSILPHIFEPFFTTKSKRGGTGLGLAAVHGLVVGMNGRISVRSEINVGTRFDLYFPASYRKPIPLAEFFNERTVPLGAGETVLIAQRDASLRPLFEEKIAALGYEAIGFSSMSALKIWLSTNHSPPHLILLDMDLWEEPPDCSAVKAQFTPVPTIFMTDHQTTLAGARSFKDISTLRKPVSSINLATTLYNMVRGQGSAIDVLSTSVEEQQ